MSVRIFSEYMREQMDAIARHKWFMSEKAGRDVGYDEAIKDFVARGFAKKFHDDYFLQHHITAIDSDVQQVSQNGNGHTCLVLELKVVLHNHDTGEEAVMEDDVIKFCGGSRKECSNRLEAALGLYYCSRDFKKSYKP